MTAKRTANLKLVEGAMQPDAAPPATMPILSASAVFIDDMRMRLRDAESDRDIVDHQIEAELARHQAELDREEAKHRANIQALGWRRDDVQNIVERCEAALENA